MVTKFHTGVLSDALYFDMQIPYKEFLLGDTSIFPTLVNYRSIVVGRAFPVEGERSKKLNLDTVNNMLDSFPNRSIYFMKSNINDIATFGDITSKFLGQKNCAGAIITGKTRDVDYLCKEYPTFCSGFTCVDAFDQWNIKSFGEPIKFRDIEISTNTFIYADRDAVLVVRDEWLEELYNIANKRLDKENKIRKDIKRGMSSYEVAERNGRW